MKFEKCEICNIETNRFVNHKCRVCGKSGVVCSDCSLHISSKRHIQSVTDMKKWGMGGTLWSTGFCTFCNKAEIRDRKLESIGI